MSSGHNQPTHNQMAVRLVLSFLLFSISLTANAGVALQLFYRNIPGLNVADLRKAPSFPDKPTSAEAITSGLERLKDNGDDYGTWTRGYIVPPQTGDYTFFLASDDRAELWLSKDSATNDLKLIARTIKAANERQFDETESQRSQPISLVKGDQYYFELLFKERGKRDHLSVAWKRPDGTMEVPVPSHCLLPLPMDANYNVVEKAPVILSEYFGASVDQLTNVTVWEGEAVAFSVSVEATPPVSFQWFRNGEPIADANLLTYSLPHAGIENDVDSFTVVVSNKMGTATAQAIVSVLPNTFPPTIQSASRGFDAESIIITFSKKLEETSASTPENYQVGSEAVKAATLGADRKTVVLRSPLFASGSTNQVEVKGVKDTATPPNSIVPASVLIEPAMRIWYRFDEATTNNLVDSSGNGLNAELFNEPSWVEAGRVGGSLSFNGQEQYASLPGDSYKVSQGFSVAFWAKPAGRRMWARFIDFGNGPSGDNIIIGRRHSSDDLFFQTFHGASTSGQVIATGALETGRWQHFAVTLDAAGKAAIYKDGALIKEANVKPARNIPRRNNFVGRSNWPSDKFYEGDLDDFRWYERPLTAQEIKGLAQ